MRLAVSAPTMLVAALSACGQDGSQPAPRPEGAVNVPDAARSHAAEVRTLWDAIQSIEIDVPYRSGRDVAVGLSWGPAIALYPTFEPWRERDDETGHLANALYCLGEDYIGQALGYLFKLDQEGPHADLFDALFALAEYYDVGNDEHHRFEIAGRLFEALATRGVRRSHERAGTAYYAQAIRAQAQGAESTALVRAAISSLDAAVGEDPDRASTYQMRGEACLMLAIDPHAENAGGAEPRLAFARRAVADLERSVAAGGENLRRSRDLPARRRLSLGDARMHLAEMTSAEIPASEALIRRAIEAYEAALKLDPELEEVDTKLAQARRRLASVAGGQ